MRHLVFLPLPVGLAVGIALLLAKRIALREQLLESVSHVASRDAMTGLFNRGAVEQILDQEMRRAEIEDHPLTIVFIDLDNLKMVNDTRGHEAGDDLIRSAADILKGVLRGSDYPCRMGDEFLLILPFCCKEEAGHILQRAQGEVERLNQDLSRPYTIGFSWGIAWYQSERHKSWESFVKDADHAMYRQKRQKKGGS